MKSTPWRILIAPSRIALAKLEARLVGEIDAHFRLKDRIDAVRDRFDAVVIDARRRSAS